MAFHIPMPAQLLLINYWPKRHAITRAPGDNFFGGLVGMALSQSPLARNSEVLDDVLELDQRTSRLLVILSSQWVVLATADTVVCSVATEP